MKILYRTSIVAFVFIIALSASGSGKEAEKIIGKWKFDDKALNLIWEFQPNGRFIFNNSGKIEKGTWERKNDILTIQQDGEKKEAKKILKLTADVLLLDEDGTKFKFKRIK